MVMGWTLAEALVDHQHIDHCIGQNVGISLIEEPLGVGLCQIRQFNFVETFAPRKKAFCLLLFDWEKSRNPDRALHVDLVA